MSTLGTDLGVALVRLASQDVEQKVGAVEDLGHVTNRVIDCVIEEFVKPGPARFLIFERLGRFGSLIEEPLEQLLERSAESDQELRILTAAALLSLGSTTGVRVLLQAVNVDEPLVCVAARVLAAAEIAEAAVVIEEALYRCDRTSTQVIECLVIALRRFGEPLPDRVVARIRTVEPAWFRDSLLKLRPGSRLSVPAHLVRQPPIGPWPAAGVCGGCGVSEVDEAAAS